MAAELGYAPGKGGASEGQPSSTPELIFIGALTAIGSLFCYRLFRPYASPIVFAVVLAIIFYPLHRSFLRIVHSQSGAAFASTLSTLLLSIVPMALLTVFISRELTQTYQSITQKNPGQGAAAFLNFIQGGVDWIAIHFPLLPRFDAKAALVSQLERASGALLQAGAGFVANVLSFITDFVITFLVLFFLFRDGEQMILRTAAALPLQERHWKEILRRVSSTVIANFYGGIAVAAAQGSLAGIGYWIVGIQSPVMWGFATGVCSLVPLIGSATVWVPISVLLLATGHWIKALAIVAWGSAVVGLVDNIVRPWIVSERTELHPIFIFFALLGGVRVFGLLGIFVGPVIISITLALIQFLSEYAQRSLSESASPVS